MPVILLTNHYDKEPLEIAQSKLPEGFSLIMPEKATAESVLEIAEKADYILASGRVKIDGRLLDGAPNLRMVQRTGVGKDTLIVDDLKERHIPAYVNGGVNANSVAEHTVMLILALLRRVTEINAQLKSGTWIKQKNGLKNRELKNMTVGLVGFGIIGKKVAELLAPFGTRIIYFDPVKADKETEERLGVEKCEYEDLLRQSDVVSFHCGLSEKTRHILGPDIVSLLKEDAIVINTARGGVIDEDCLLEALQQGKIRAAALDVYEEEPPVRDGALIDRYAKLAAMDNVIMTSHVAGVTAQSFAQMMQEAMENIDNFHKGNLEAIEEKRIV